MATKIVTSNAIVFSAALSMTLPVMSVTAQPQQGKNVDKARVIAHWTSDRRAAAIPRDLVIDPRGYAYLRKPDGSLQPYGHRVAAVVESGGVKPNARPPSSGDNTAPDISDMNPDTGATIGSSHEFSATVTDDSGVKSVSFTVQKDGSIPQSFNANPGPNDSWTVGLQGFSDGNWSWTATAKDNASRGGNSVTSELVSFTVGTGGGGNGGGSGDGIITNAAWSGGVVQLAAGRIYFEMPKNQRKKRWDGYVCSGTVVTDGTDNGRSIILSAAHCVYDDANKAFARNVLFIPNQAGGGSRTDLNCGNDPVGCWTPSFGVVDPNWTAAVFPDNIPWDYAYYVVVDGNSHAGAGGDEKLVLDVEVSALTISFGAVAIDDNTAGGGNDFTHALGYSYSEDPAFMYCAEDMTTEGNANWWLPSCGLSGGSSGGPWIQPLDTADPNSATYGSGPIISVNSWGYTTSPGMAGPKLVGTSASCLFITAKDQSADEVSTADGEAGVVASCPPPPPP